MADTAASVGLTSLVAQGDHSTSAICSAGLMMLVVQLRLCWIFATDSLSSITQEDVTAPGVAAAAVSAMVGRLKI